MKRVFVLFAIAQLALVSIFSVASTQAAPLATLAERVNQKKSEVKLSLDSATQANIVKRCKVSQTLIDKTWPVVQSGQKAISDRYTETLKKLEDMQSRIASQKNIDSTKYMAAYEKLKADVVKVKELAVDFEQTMKDAVDINCTADAVGFKSLVDSARQTRESIQSTKKAIKQDLADIKQEFATFRSKAVK